MWNGAALLVFSVGAGWRAGRLMLLLFFSFAVNVARAAVEGVALVRLPEMRNLLFVFACGKEVWH